MVAVGVPPVRPDLVLSAWHSHKIHAKALSSPWIYCECVAVNTVRSRQLLMTEEQARGSAEIWIG